MFEPTGTLVGEIKEPISPELGTVDHGTYRRFRTAQDVSGTSEDLSRRVAGSPASVCPGCDVEDPGNIAELGDWKRFGRREMIEVGKLIGAVPGEPLEAERIDVLAVDSDLELALLAQARPRRRPATRARGARAPTPRHLDRVLEVGHSGSRPCPLRQKVPPKA